MRVIDDMKAIMSSAEYETIVTERTGCGMRDAGLRLFL